MDAVVAELAVAEIPEPVPVIVDQILMVRLQGGGTQPQVPVEPGRRLHGLLEPDGIAAAGEEEIGLVDVADLAAMDELDRLAEAAPPAALRAAGGDPLVLSRRLDELRALPNIVRDGLFDVDIFARLHGPDGGERVPVISGGDGDRVDLLVLEDAAHIGIDFGTLAGLLKDRRGRGFGAASVRVYQRGNFDIGNGEDFANMRGTARADSDDREADAVIRAGPGLRGRRGGGYEKMTAVHKRHQSTPDVGQDSIPMSFTSWK